MSSSSTAELALPRVAKGVVDFGISIFVTDETIAPGDLGSLAEERGFESLFVPEHLHMPRNSVRKVGRHYYRSLDPFVTLAAAAGGTTTLRLGFGILLLTQRDPITTAKAIASLDVVSGGRVEVGVGAGWNVPEVENHGTPFDRRFGVLRERVEAMKAIWTNDEASYHGRYVRFEAVMSWPKPVQKPHPPIWVGGTGARTPDRVLRYGDGWIPNSRERLAERIADLRQRAEEAGRGRVPVTVFGVPPDPDVVDELAAAGVDRVLFMLPSAPPPDVRQAADAAADVAQRFR
jgi:probable F420-dependent oxidoreductase